MQWQLLLIAVVLATFLTVPDSCMAKKKVKAVQRDSTAWMFNDSTLLKNVGDTLYQTLTQPDTVKCYHLFYKEHASEHEHEAVPNFVRDSITIRLTPSQIAAMQFTLLSDTCNFKNDSVFVQSPYLPTLEFEFIKDSLPTVSIVMSTLNRSWQILSNGKELTNYNISDLKAIERFCNYFENKKNKKEDKK